MSDSGALFGGGKPISAGVVVEPPDCEGAADERELMARMARSDEAALDQLYRRYAGPLFSFVFRVLGSREEAEEVLQDVFVRLWEKASAYDPAQSKPFTWAYMMARGACYDRLRKSGRRGPGGGRASPCDSDPGAADPQIVAREDVRRVLAALAALPAAERQAVEMAVFLEYTGVEISDRLCEPLGTIKSRVRRGMIRLRHLLKPHD